MESWAFAMDAVGLKIALDRGVYNERVCKLCDDGVVVMGEYGLSISLMAAGYTFDTLMYKYGGVDWRDEANWKCNNQVYSRKITLFPAVMLITRGNTGTGTFMRVSGVFGGILE